MLGLIKKSKLETKERMTLAPTGFIKTSSLLEIMIDINKWSWMRKLDLSKKWKSARSNLRSEEILELVIEEIATLEGEPVEPSLVVKAQQDSKMPRTNMHIRKING